MEQQTPPDPAEESIFDEADFSIYDKHVRTARRMLYVFSGVVWVPVFQLFPIDDSYKWILLVSTFITSAVFAGTAWWSNKKPYTAMLVALIYYIGEHALALVFYSPAIISGFWIIKIFVVLTLVLGIRNGKQIQDRQELFGK